MFLGANILPMEVLYKWSGPRQDKPDTVRRKCKQRNKDVAMGCTNVLIETCK